MEVAGHARFIFSIETAALKATCIGTAKVPRPGPRTINVFSAGLVAQLAIWRQK